MMIIAPTGSGKTEVFLMPVVYSIARSITENPNNPRNFIFLYPRVALLKDQLKRIFRCVHLAEQNGSFHQQGSLFGSAPQVSDGQKIVIGFQFSGILSDGRDTLNNPDIFENRRRLKLLTTVQYVTKAFCNL
jgi:CRISPR/Cas system-associated endonuclease/helicase Cas3